VARWGSRSSLQSSYRGASDGPAAFTDGLQLALTFAAGAVALGAVVVVALLHRAEDRFGGRSPGRERVDLAGAT